MKNRSEFFQDYKMCLEDFLGFKIDMETNKELVIKLDDVNKELLELNQTNLQGIMTIMAKTLDSFYDSHNTLDYKPIFKQLLSEELVYNFINTDKSIHVKLSEFIELLKGISVKTYETKPTEMGFLVIKQDSFEIEEYLNNLDISYIPLDEPIDLHEYINEKQSLLLIDSKSLSFVIDSNFKLIGLAQKRKSKQSIINIMMERHRILEEANVKILAHQNYIKDRLRHDATEHKSKMDVLSNTEMELEKSLMQLLGGNISADEIPKVAVELLRQGVLTGEQKEELVQKMTLLVSIFDEQLEINEKMKEEGDEYLTNLKKARAFVDEIAGSMTSIELHSIVDFVFIRNKQIFWGNSPDYIVSYNNGNWKIRNYFILRSIITKFIMSQYTILSDNNTFNIGKAIRKIKDAVPRVIDLYNLIKTLSDKNIGSLICILRNTNLRKLTLYKQMLQDGKLSSTKFQGIIQTQRNNNLNLRSCDPYLFELICSVDGAIILDRVFNILSFGEMINSQEEAVNNGKVYRGARTKAAISASRFGLAIKVSEDGDITVFDKFSELVRI